MAWSRYAQFLRTGDCGLVNVYALLAGLVGGLFAVYWTAPDRRIIEITPSPENAGKIQYKDEADRYFEFREERVACAAGGKPPKQESFQVGRALRGVTVHPPSIQSPP